MRSRGRALHIGRLPKAATTDLYTEVSARKSGRESPPWLSGRGSLVMSGRGRKLYQSFKPKTEGAIFVKRSMPQCAKNSPHDTTTSFVKLAAFGTYKVAKLALLHNLAHVWGDVS